MPNSNPKGKPSAVKRGKVRKEAVAKKHAAKHPNDKQATKKK